MAVFGAAVLAALLRLSAGQEAICNYTYDALMSSGSPGGNSGCQSAQAQPAPASCRCGYKKLNRIVDGEETGENVFPMMAVVFNSHSTWGGTIIDHRHLITCAHTFHEGYRDLTVTVGVHNITYGVDSPSTKSFGVENVLIHPQFNKSNFDYDIAILRVNKDIEFTDRVGPACLPFKFTDTTFTGLNVTLLGWGRVTEYGPSSNVLRKVVVSVISQSSCEQAASVSDLTPRHFCTYTPGKDACKGDSGGPVLYMDPATDLFFLIGVISNGRGCAMQDCPGINIRVSEFLDWIRDNTPGAEHCNK